jgi:hypothetical protein
LLAVPDPLVVVEPVPPVAVAVPVVPDPVVLPEPVPPVAVLVGAGEAVAAVVGEAVALVPDPLLVDPVLLDDPLLAEPLLELVDPVLLAAAPNPASTKV